MLGHYPMEDGVNRIIYYFSTKISTRYFQICNVWLVGKKNSQVHLIVSVVMK